MKEYLAVVIETTLNTTARIFLSRAALLYFAGTGLVVLAGLNGAALGQGVLSGSATFSGSSQFSPSSGPLTYSARTDNCVTGAESGCISGATTGEAGSAVSFQLRPTDSTPSGFAGTTINTGSCPSGLTPSSYPAYCPAPMNSTATDPDFGAYMVMATDDSTNSPVSSTPYASSFPAWSDGESDYISADESLVVLLNSKGGWLLENISPTSIHAKTCASSPCVNSTGIFTASSGNGDSTHLAHGGNFAFSRNPATPHLLFEETTSVSPITAVTVTSSISSPGAGTLSRCIYADFILGSSGATCPNSGSFGGVLLNTALGNTGPFYTSWIGTPGSANDGTFGALFGGGFDWQADWTVTATDTFIWPQDANNPSGHGYQATTGGATGSTRPVWNGAGCSGYTVGSTCVDGAETWVDIGVIGAQGKQNFYVVIYGPPGSADPGYTLLNTRLAKVYRGTGNSAPGGQLYTYDALTCGRTNGGVTPCPFTDLFVIHDGELMPDGRYISTGPTGGEGPWPGTQGGAWNQYTLNCQTGGSWAGIYSAGTAYSNNQVVSYSGYYYTRNSTTGGAGNAPSGTTSSNTYWSAPTEAYCDSYFFDIASTGQAHPIMEPLTDWNHGSGHHADGYGYRYYGGKYYGTVLSSNPYSNLPNNLPVINGALNPGTGLISALLPCDDHGTNRNAGTGDLQPVFTLSTCRPAWTATTLGYGYVAANYGEVDAFSTSPIGTNYRFAHVYNTGSEAAFSSQNNIGVIGPLGDIAIFGTDMMGKRGSTAAANTAANNLRGMYSPSKNNANVNLNDTISFSNGDNGSQNVYQATACSGACVEGSTLPDWNTVCPNAGNTCPDGTITWTNLGPNVNRGDAVIVDLLSAYAAP